MRKSTASDKRQRVFGLTVLALTMLMLSGCVPNEMERNGAGGSGTDPNGTSASYAEQDVERKLLPAGSGYVINTDRKEGILVVSPEKQDFSANGGSSDYYDATFFSDAPEANEIRVGMRVTAWVEEGGVMMASYPGQISAAHIEIQEDNRPEGAQLEPYEAVRRAIESVEGKNGGVPVVLEAHYDKEQQAWTVDLLDDVRKPVSVIVEDQV